MEVHHHPELPHSKKKKFKEYFLEFLMIFLAVLMGFIAENIREHLSDNAKEYEYVNGMIKNLEIDTVNLNASINGSKKIIAGIDTLRSIPKEKLSDKKYQDSLYLYTLKYLFTLNIFKTDDATLIQLRNAGGYRLIRKEGVLDSIANLESQINVIGIQYGFLSAGVTKAFDDASAIFDLNGYTKFAANPATNILISTDKDKINSFYNQCFMVVVQNRNYTQYLKEHLRYCTMLIGYLKKQYGID